jgi:hypothetical protein
VLLLCLVTLWAWGFALGLPLTGPDTWPILAQGERLWNAPIRTLTEPYLEGLWEGATFWRPGVVLVAGLERATIGEWPTAHHALRLLLLVGTAAAAGALAARREGRARAAWLVAAGIYLLHPIQAETVPVVARWADGATALATAACLLCLSRYGQAGRSRWLVLGVLAALAAPAFKESGLVAPLVGLVAVEPWSRTSGRQRERLVAAGALVAVAAAHVAARFALIGTLGRYERVFDPHSPSEAAASLLRGMVAPQGVNPMTGAGLALIGVALLAHLALSRRDQPPSGGRGAPRWAPVRNACLVWIAAGVAGMIGSPRFYERYAEGLLVPVAVLAGAAVAGAAGLRATEAGLMRRWLSPGLLVAGIAGVLSPGTPLMYSYPHWALAGSTARSLVAETRRGVEAVRADGQRYQGRVGRYEVDVSIRGELAIVRVDPFPFKVAPRLAEPGAARVETAMVATAYGLRSALELEGLGPAEVVPGRPVMDHRPADLSPER